MKKIFVSALTIVSIGQSFAATHKSLYTVSTFECIGIYCKVDSADLGECKVNYRPSGSKQWKNALPLWFDERDNEYRGSIVGLTPNTEYEVELAYGEHKVQFKTRTRSEEFKIGKTTYLDTGVKAGTIHITESGNADGWHLVTPKPPYRS